MRRTIAVAVCLSAVAFAPSASAGPLVAHRQQGHTPLETKYLKLYWHVVRSHGRRAPGRNVVTRGIKARTNHVRPASRHELAVSIRQLRRLLHPAPPLLVRTAQPPAQPPAGVSSPGVAVGSGHMACIISHESGGNPKATNGQYHGIGQWSPESWARWGGTKYASDPTGATYQQQLMVLASEGDSGMTQEQGVWDGCG